MNEEKVFEMLGRLNATTELILEQTRKTNGRVTCLESRVDKLESKGDADAGAKAVKKTFWDHFWDVGKIAIGALIGLVIGGVKK